MIQLLSVRALDRSGIVKLRFIGVCQGFVLSMSGTNTTLRRNICNQKMDERSHDIEAIGGRPTCKTFLSVVLWLAISCSNHLHPLLCISVNNVLLSSRSPTTRSELPHAKKSKNHCGGPPKQSKQSTPTEKQNQIPFFKSTQGS